MKCVYFTKPKRLSEQFLEYMIDCGDDVLAVVLDDPDRWVDTPLAELCSCLGISVIGYEDCDGFFDSADELDTLWCQTFPKLIKQEWCDKARICAVNFHSAPLPEYRGAFAFNFAILNGETSYGVTAHRIAAGFDSGDLIDVDRFNYDCANGSVEELVRIASTHQLEQFKRVRAMADCGDVPSVPQDESLAHYYSREMFREAKRILPSDDSTMVERRIRAFWFPPYEGAYVELAGKKYYPVTVDMLKSLARTQEVDSKSSPVCIESLEGAGKDGF